MLVPGIANSHRWLSEPHRILCDVCKHRFAPGCPFFSCKVAKSGDFDLCLECILDAETLDEQQKLRPCYLDPRDERPTFLSAPSVQDFIQSVTALKTNESLSLPSPVWQFMSQTTAHADATLSDRDQYFRNEAKFMERSVQNIKVENDYSFYSKLRTNTKDIRLINLVNGLEDEPIVLQLLEVSLLEEERSWTALSYCWGSLWQTRSVYLELECRCVGHTAASRCQECRREFRVTANLEIALRAFRKSTRDVLVWVDALCINQGDQDERAFQVGIMRDIYASASSVSIWLGLPGAGDNGNTHRNFWAIQYVTYWLDAVKRSGEQLSTNWKAIAERFLSGHQGRHPMAEDVARMLNEVFQNPW